MADSLVVDTSSAAEQGELLLFVVLSGVDDEHRVAGRLRSTIRTELSPRHVPNQVIPVAGVPRTLNGKKCEVPVKRILSGTPIDVALSRDALADPAGFDAFLALAWDALGVEAPDAGQDQAMAEALGEVPVGDAPVGSDDPVSDVDRVVDAELEPPDDESAR